MDDVKVQADTSESYQDGNIVHVKIRAPRNETGTLIITGLPFPNPQMEVVLAPEPKPEA